MKYARSPYMMSVHLANDDTLDDGKAFCGRGPSHNEWHGNHRRPRWLFYDANPDRDESLICKACQKAAKKKG